METDTKNATIDRAASAAEQIIDEKVGAVATAIEGAANLLTNDLPEAAQPLSHVTAPAGAKLQELAKTVRQQSGKVVVSKAKKVITEYPRATVAIAAAVGAVGAQLVVRALRSERVSSRRKPKASMTPQAS